VAHRLIRPKTLEAICCCAGCQHPARNHPERNLIGRATAIDTQWLPDPLSISVARLWGLWKNYRFQWKSRLASFLRASQ